MSADRSVPTAETERQWRSRRVTLWAIGLALATLVIFAAFARSQVGTPPDVTIPPHPSVVPGGQ